MLPNVGIESTQRDDGQLCEAMFSIERTEGALPFTKKRAQRLVDRIADDIKQDGRVRAYITDDRCTIIEVVGVGKYRDPDKLMTLVIGAIYARPI